METTELNEGIGMSRSAGIEVTRKGDERVLRISGACGSKCASELDKEIWNQVRSGAKRLSLDLSNADYVETSVLRVILDSARDLALTDTSIKVERLSPSARRTFDLLQLDWILSDEAKGPNRFRGDT